MVPHRCLLAHFEATYSILAVANVASKWASKQLWGEGGGGPGGTIYFAVDGTCYLKVIEVYWKE